MCVHGAEAAAGAPRAGGLHVSMENTAAHLSGVLQMPSGDSMGLFAIFGEVPVFLGFSQKKKITIRELFPMKPRNHNHESRKEWNPKIPNNQHMVLRGGGNHIAWP